MVYSEYKILRLYFQNQLLSNILKLIIQFLIKIAFVGCIKPQVDNNFCNRINSTSIIDCISQCYNKEYTVVHKFSASDNYYLCGCLSESEMLNSVQLSNSTCNKTFCNSNSVFCGGTISNFSIGANDCLQFNDRQRIFATYKCMQLN